MIRVRIFGIKHELVLRVYEETREINFGGLLRRSPAGCCAAENIFLQSRLLKRPSKNKKFSKVELERERNQPTIHIIPNPLRRPTINRHLILIRILQLSNSKSLKQSKRTPTPPRITPIHKLIRPAFKPTQLNIHSLHMHKPPQQIPHIDLLHLRFLFRPHGG